MYINEVKKYNTFANQLLCMTSNNIRVQKNTDFIKQCFSTYAPWLPGTSSVIIKGASPAVKTENKIVIYCHNYFSRTHEVYVII